jgi:hypothetical protein
VPHEGALDCRTFRVQRSATVFPRDLIEERGMDDERLKFEDISIAAPKLVVKRISAAPLPWHPFGKEPRASSDGTMANHASQS